MRKALSVLLVLVMSLGMVFSVTGCKKTTHYTSPLAVIEGFENGDKIIEQKCTVTVSANMEVNTVRREIYKSLYDKSFKSDDYFITVSIPSSQTMSNGETATLVITDIKGSNGIYEIYAYKK